MHKRILLVADDPVLRLQLTPELQRRQLLVLMANSGQEANAILAVERIDMIVVDRILADADGIEWLAGARARGVRALVALVSAIWCDRVVFKRLTSQLGVSLIVHKPIIPNLLAEQITEELDDEERKQSAWVNRQRQQRPTPLGNATIQVPTSCIPRALLADNPEEAEVAMNDVIATHTNTFVRDDGPSEDAHDDDNVLPLARGSAAANDTPPAAPPTLLGAPSPLTTDGEPVFELTSQDLSAGHILMVTTDPLLEERAVQECRRLLIELTVVATIEAAVDKTRKLVPEAVAIDTDLVGPGGAVRLVRELRTLPGCDAVRFALFGGSDNLAQRVAVMHAGAAHGVEKPVPRPILAKVFSDLVAFGNKAEPHIMLVDDDPELATRTAFLLRHAGMSVEVVSDAHDVLPRLHRKPPDLLILDVLLPGMGGLDLCRMLRTSPRWRELPIVFLTVSNGVHSRVAAYEAGGDDVLCKPVADVELIARVRGRLERARLTHERAERDPLTGLITRGPFIDELVIRLADAQRQKRPLTLSLIDLDHFKLINESYGHLAGDRILMAFGNLLLSTFRMTDLRGRWGGDEFAVAFPGETQESSRAVMQRLRHDFFEMSFEVPPMDEVDLTFTTGTATFPEDGGDERTLLRVAETRLMEAKSSQGAAAAG